ncbi:hypothetical protein WR25_25092 [Diploscapter pachys]|uniref:Cysteine-rich DPF motif domain-containing protein 1 n=1 Tax=Diploscapter pachys TaxID=2018661 RepID=A0A2A2LHX7_9BILA|nr:hypothetical protein WR25_25092 [Diploscapter pachys]
MMSEEVGEGSKEAETGEETEDVTQLNPFIQFECGICGMKENTLHGNLQVSDGFFNCPVFFVRDPFIPYTRVRARKPCLADFLVLGGTCSMCERSVCIDKACSVYFGARFCAICVIRERRRFPEKVVEATLKAQAQAEASAAKSN